MRNPGGQTQRQHILDHGGNDALLVQANLVAVAHGHLRPEGEPASLIITDFAFVPARNSRRFVSAVISYSFASMKSTDSGPVVSDIAPNGYFSMNPPETTKVTSSPALSITQEGDAKVNFGSEISWALIENLETTGHATLTGSIREETHDYEDTARWTLMEDDTTDKGIPSFFRTAILLCRKNNERFQAIVDIKTSSDWLSTVESTVSQVSGRRGRADPVIFDPSLPPFERTDHLLAEIDLENLENPVWKRLGAVASTREALSDAAKGESSFQIPQIPAGRHTASFR